MELQRLGPYRIQRILGSGGMGIVYAGIDDESGQQVAIKVLSRVLGSNEAFRDRFNAEIETLKKLHHPHIVQLFGYGEQDGQLFYSMELVEGSSLQDELQKGKRFDWQDVTRIAIQVCQALKHAHDHGVIHRDLKPANLMWSVDRVIKLSDFGIAKLFGGTHITAAGSVIGTADFMSPEQADSKPVTHRSDLYSLGSVMFALLARRPPFAAPSVPEVLHALKYDEPPPLKRFAPETPKPLQEIIHQLLEKDPEQRVANAYVLSNQLKSMEFGLASPTRVDEQQFAADGEPTFSAPGSSAERMPPEAPQTAPARQPHEPPLNRERSASRSGGATSMGENTSTRPTAEHRGAIGSAGAGGEENLTLYAESAPPAQETEDASEEPDSHFIPVQPEQRRANDERPPHPPDSASWAKLGAGLALAAILALVGWRMSRPPSADEIFGRIEAAADDSSQLVELETEIERFLQRFPQDPRCSQVRDYLIEAELERFSQRMSRQLRRPQGTGSLSPAESAYLEALREENSAPEQAARKLQALIDVYSTVDPRQDPVSALSVKMARRKLASLKRSLKTSQARAEKVLAQRIQWARENQAAEPDAARDLLQGIVVLYGEKPWATELVEQAKRLLKP